MLNPRPPVGRLFLVVLGLLISFVFLETLTRVYSAATTPRVDPNIPDTRLGGRPNPAYPGHDARGWRNPSALRQADIVVFGDSQTYSYNAAVDESWPHRLGRYLRRSAYQMAFPGYGPAHYILLLDEAMTLRPRVIVAAYYFGNDLYDGYSLAYRTGDYKHRGDYPLLESLVTKDAKTQEAITRRQSQDPNSFIRFQRLNCGLPPVPDVTPTELLYGPVGGNGNDAVPVHRPQAARHRVLGALGRLATFRLVWPHLRPRLDFVFGPPEDYGPPLCVHHEVGGMRTFFNVGYRLIALDEGDPRILEGGRVNLRALRYLAESSRRVGIDFYAALIPTKEMAFRKHVERSGGNHPLLAKLWNAETRARNDVIAYLEREDIRFIDTLPDLEALIASRVNPYPEGIDGHPVAAGYDAIARSVADRLGRDGLANR